MNNLLEKPQILWSHCSWFCSQLTWSID